MVACGNLINATDVRQLSEHVRAFSQKFLRSLQRSHARQAAQGWKLFVNLILLQTKKSIRLHDGK